ncbi:farnesyltransferas-like protein [Lepidopterella palustris CBS 459.81]|uniref:Protein farnesyltransferase/geranylgeranyltransferase type-1 subunit alpha n=1 Tax=Lepidopterella palustris CBS 459.81 TaxID=1314670 RepID=A0A8E2E072_9PEZI|nr:farnesyltransferas-like protein [Lepidopterella palustris CBS 459.81]
MSKYSDDPAWSDIVPLPQDDGGPNPLAAIAYKDEYSEAMSYLRAVMAENEMSERVLGLTEHIISMNPAHYTVWLYRAKCLFTLSSDLKAEIAWLNPTALKHLKNYQIWHHRQTIIEKLDSADGEVTFISSMLEADSKNYHVWSYRQWLVRRFDLWHEGELEAVEGMLKEDVRNNSAWNHRWFVVFGNEKMEGVDDGVLEREMDYAKAAIYMTPQNQSPWNYLRGLLRYAKLPASTLKEFALEFASPEKPDEVHSSHALDLLADIYAEEENKKEAEKALDLLAKRFDPIRANYWNYRKSLLELPAAAS